MAHLCPNAECARSHVASVYSLTVGFNGGLYSVGELRRQLETASASGVADTRRLYADVVDDLPVPGSAWEAALEINR